MVIECCFIQHRRNLFFSHGGKFTHDVVSKPLIAGRMFYHGLNDPQLPLHQIGFDCNVLRGTSEYSTCQTPGSVT
jgi:hypothetical protein